MQSSFRHTSVQVSCCKVEEVDGVSFFGPAFGWLIHSDVIETAVWIPADCRTEAGTEVGAVVAGAAGGGTEFGTETNPGTEIWVCPDAKESSKAVDETFGEPDIEIVVSAAAKAAA